MSWFKNRTGGESYQLLPPRIRDAWGRPLNVLIRPLMSIADSAEVYKDDVRMRLQTLASAAVLEYHLRRLVQAIPQDLRVADLLTDTGTDFEVRIKPSYNTVSNVAAMRAWLDQHKLHGKTYKITFTEYVLTPPDYAKQDYSGDYNRTL